MTVADALDNLLTHLHRWASSQDETFGKEYFTIPQLAHFFTTLNVALMS